MSIRLFADLPVKHGKPALADDVQARSLELLLVVEHALGSQIEGVIVRPRRDVVAGPRQAVQDRVIDLPGHGSTQEARQRHPEADHPQLES